MTGVQWQRREQGASGMDLCIDLPSATFILLPFLSLAFKKKGILYIYVLIFSVRVIK